MKAGGWVICVSKGTRVDVGFERKGGRRINKINLYLKNAIMKPNTVHVNLNKTKTTTWPASWLRGLPELDSQSHTKVEGEK